MSEKTSETLEDISQLMYSPEVSIEKFEELRGAVRELKSKEKIKWEQDKCKERNDIFLWRVSLVKESIVGLTFNMLIPTGTIIAYLADPLKLWSTLQTMSSLWDIATKVSVFGSYISASVFYWELIRSTPKLQERRRRYEATYGEKLPKEYYAYWEKYEGKWLFRDFLSKEYLSSYLKANLNGKHLSTYLKSKIHKTTEEGE